MTVISLQSKGNKSFFLFRWLCWNLSQFLCISQCPQRRILRARCFKMYFHRHTGNRSSQFVDRDSGANILNRLDDPGKGYLPMAHSWLSDLLMQFKIALTRHLSAVKADDSPEQTLAVRSEIKVLTSMKNFKTKFTEAGQFVVSPCTGTSPLQKHL